MLYHKYGFPPSSTSWVVLQWGLLEALALMGVLVGLPMIFMLMNVSPMDLLVFSWLQWCWGSATNPTTHHLPPHHPYWVLGAAFHWARLSYMWPITLDALQWSLFFICMLLQPHIFPKYWFLWLAFIQSVQILLKYLTYALALLLRVGLTRSQLSQGLKFKKKKNLISTCHRSTPLLHGAAILASSIVLAHTWINRMPPLDIQENCNINFKSSAHTTGILLCPRREETWHVLRSSILVIELLSKLDLWILVGS